jgi:hypothetical protein
MADIQNIPIPHICHVQRTMGGHHMTATGIVSLYAPTIKDHYPTLDIRAARKTLDGAG